MDVLGYGVDLSRHQNPALIPWSDWKGRIDFVDGHNFEFASQRSFNTAVEAEDYLRRFACNHIDHRLSLTGL
jgi:hypothetical protein